MNEFWINHGIWGVRILTQHCVDQLVPYRGFNHNEITIRFSKSINYSSIC
jgi:hypothetical protein